MAILLTFHILLAATLVWVGVAAFSRLSAQREIFREFRLRGALRFAVLLYPIAPIALVIGLVKHTPLVSGALAVLCFLPGMILSRLVGRRLETSGTDRTKPAAEATSLATTGAITGLIYTALVVGLQLLTSHLLARNV